MTSPGRFGGVVTAMATPFASDGSLDIDGSVSLARWLCSQGSEALVLAGTTGEGPVLSDAEKVDLWRSVAQAVTVPVIANTGTYDTSHSIELTRKATAAGVAGMLVVTPYYNRPSQAGIEAHFRAVAAATPLPVVIYDIPFRTGRAVAIDTMLRLASDVRNIVGVKDATGDVPRAARLIAEAPAGFECYSGEDAFTLPLLALGAVGVISVASHWAGPQLSDMVAAFFDGKLEEARSLNGALLESYSFESTEAAPNPVPTKAMLQVLGQPGGVCRLPMGPPPAGLLERAAEVLAALAGEGARSSGPP